MNFAYYKDFFYSGLSGLQLPIPKYLYPPAFEHASRLTYYASLFNSIEINSSFYKIPRAATVIKWGNSVSENFKFTFKLWKEITHIKNLDFREEDVLKFLRTIDSIGSKKGCLLIQLPPGLEDYYSSQLDKLLSIITTTNREWKVAVEFRNKKWYKDSTYDLLKSHKTALVVQDIPKSSTPLVNHTSDFIYIRFHGPTGNYRDSYDEDFLNEYATYINEWLQEGKQVFVYFNNTMGDAINNLTTLNNLLLAKININKI